MTTHRRSPTPDHFKVAGSTHEDRDLAAEARRKVTQERKRQRVRTEKIRREPGKTRARKKAAPDREIPVASPFPNTVENLSASSPRRADRFALLRFAWSMSASLLRAGVSAALRRIIPDSTRS